MSWLSPKRRRTTTALPTVGDRIKNGVDEQRPLSPSPRFTSPKPVLPSPSLKQRASRTFSTASATSAAATIEEEGNLFYAYARRVCGLTSCYTSHAILIDKSHRPTNSTLDTCLHSLPRKSRANGGHWFNRAIPTLRVQARSCSRSEQTTSSSRLGSMLRLRTFNQMDVHTIRRVFKRRGAGHNSYSRRPGKHVGWCWQHFRAAFSRRA